MRTLAALSMPVTQYRKWGARGRKRRGRGEKEG